MTRSLIARGTRQARPPGCFRVVYLTNQFLLPAHCGGQLREYETLVRLAQFADIDFLAVTEFFDRDARYVYEGLDLFNSITLMEADTVDEDRPPSGVPERLWRYRCAGLAEAVAASVQAREPDVVHVEGYFMMQHLSANARSPVLLVEENIEFLLDEEREKAGDEFLSEGTSAWSRSAEVAAWRRAAVCGAVTHHDVGIIRRVLPEQAVRWVPSGCDHLAGPLGSPLASGRRVPPCVVFVANVSWPPSRDAAIFLVRNVWPLIREEVKNANLVIAGAGDCDELTQLSTAAEGVEVLGEVPSVAPVLQRGDVFVCPLRFGGGIQTKLLEAIRAALPVVTTPLGARGLPSRLREVVLIGDDARSIADHVVELLNSPSRRYELSRRASDLVDVLPTWSEASDRLFRAWVEAARRPCAGRGLAT